MINFRGYVNENKIKHNENWPYTPDHPYRILIIGSGKIRKEKFIIKFNRKSTRH